MWPNLQETVELVTFTEEIFDRKFQGFSSWSTSKIVLLLVCIKKLIIIFFISDLCEQGRFLPKHFYWIILQQPLSFDKKWN